MSVSRPKTVSDKINVAKKSNEPQDLLCLDDIPMPNVNDSECIASTSNRTISGQMRQSNKYRSLLSLPMPPKVPECEDLSEDDDYMDLTVNSENAIGYGQNINYLRGYFNNR